eukprot:scaffold4.g4683.t1
MAYYRGGPRGAPALKPENALKRASELLGVGQPAAALQTLHDTITNKRMQRNWNKTLEEAMLKYVDLCVETKQGRKCKDGLINYRNTVQQVNVGSLEEVIKHLLNTASARADAAARAAEAKLLDADASPEEMLLSYVSGEKSKDRTDRELVTPWFKFLWETYRNALDILRNNSRLEAVYAMVASRAFGFCLAYKRTTEFRRLCDIMRNHLANLIKYRDQLRTACDLELWAEAFRTVEDIQGLVGMAPKASEGGVKGPRPALMATYYAKLTQIFTKSENRLYNAYAWYRLFTFVRVNNKGLGAPELSALASNVVLSALSILPYEQARADGWRGWGVCVWVWVWVDRHEAEAGVEQERAAKMAAVLSFKADRRGGGDQLSRARLMADIEKRGLLSLAPPEVRQIWGLLEAAAFPVAELGLEVYRPYLQQAEQLIVDAVRYGYLQARFDHKHNTVHFGGQEVESDRVHGCVAAMAKRLSAALATVAPGPSPEAAARRRALLARALATADMENHRALARKGLIEKRREEEERLLMEREREAEETRALAEALAREQEERRKQQERARREAERIQKEMEEREQEELKAFLASRGKKISEARADWPGWRGGGCWGWEEARAKARQAWESDLQEKTRVARMAEEQAAFAAAIQARHTEEFAALKAKRERELAQRRAARKAERDIARKREYVRRCRLEIEERRRAAEEEARRVDEEKRKKEAAERQRKLDEIAEKQRQREAEVEARAAAARGAAPPPAAAAAARPSGGAFVPPHLRRATAEGGGGGGGAPAAAAASRDEGPGGGGGAWRPSRPRSPPPPARDGPGGYRDDRGGAYRQEGGGEEGGAGAGQPGGGRAPPVRREDERGEGGGAYRPPVRREDEHGERGGAYRPPLRRDEPPPPRGGSRWRVQEPARRREHPFSSPEDPPDRLLSGEIGTCIKKIGEGCAGRAGAWAKPGAGGPAAGRAGAGPRRGGGRGEAPRPRPFATRARTQVRSWADSGEIKDTSALQAARRDVESRMERFKLLEKELKVKAFSSAGLSRDSTDPLTQAKFKCADWLNDVVSQLETQVEQAEADLEALGTQGPTSGKGARAKPPRAAQLEAAIVRHQGHIAKLEQVLRLLENDQASLVSPEEVEGALKDGLEYYLESSMEQDFQHDEALYDPLPLSEVDETVGRITAHTPKAGSRARLGEDGAGSEDGGAAAAAAGAGGGGGKAGKTRGGKGAKGDKGGKAAKDKGGSKQGQGESPKGGGASGSEPPSPAAKFVPPPPGLPVSPLSGAAAAAAGGAAAAGSAGAGGAAAAPPGAPGAPACTPRSASFKAAAAAGAAKAAAASPKLQSPEKPFTPAPAAPPPLSAGGGGTPAAPASPGGAPPPLAPAPPPATLHLTPQPPPPPPPPPPAAAVVEAVGMHTPTPSDSLGSRHASRGSSLGALAGLLGAPSTSNAALPPGGSSDDEQAQSLVDAAQRAHRTAMLAAMRAPPPGLAPLAVPAHAPGGAETPLATPFAGAGAGACAAQRSASAGSLPRLGGAQAAEGAQGGGGGGGGAPPAPHPPVTVESVPASPAPASSAFFAAAQQHQLGGFAAPASARALPHSAGAARAAAEQAAAAAAAASAGADARPPAMLVYQHLLGQEPPPPGSPGRLPLPAQPAPCPGAQSLSPTAALAAAVAAATGAAGTADGAALAQLPQWEPALGPGGRLGDEAEAAQHPAFERPWQPSMADLHLLDASMHNRPQPGDADWRLADGGLSLGGSPCVPHRPAVVPASYPNEVHPSLKREEAFSGLSTGTRQQLWAAKQLKDQGWRFHTEFNAWFARQSAPKVVTETYEQGPLVYFDCQVRFLPRFAPCP